MEFCMFFILVVVGGSSQEVWNIRKLQVFDAPNTFKIFDFDASKIPTEFSAAVKIQRITNINYYIYVIAII